MSSRSSSALARSYGVERAIVAIIGVLALAGGVLVLVVGRGWLGRFRAHRPLLDPLVVGWLRRYPQWSHGVAIVLGVVLLIVGLWWFARGFKPESKPDLRLDEESGEHITVTSSAIGGALESDCENIAGINKARARAVGTPAAPAVRLSLWLEDGTDVREIWEQLDGNVLARARESLGVERLPTAVRLEMDTAAAQRVQ
jgi:hypothetical protein